MGARATPGARELNDPVQYQSEKIMKQTCCRSLLYTFEMLIPILLIGCAFSNEGAIDFRKAQTLVVPGQPKTAPSSGQAEYVLLLRKDITSDDENARIEKLDKISIRLRDGFLHDCNESPIGNPFRRFNRNCEIAILFKAFELTEGQDFNFKPGAEREARLVYFSHDVQPGQFFNFHNLPIYGPLGYNGRPIGIDIFIIEIDVEDQQAFALLKSLASIGAKAYPPAAPVLGVLDQLGSALLSSGTDDIGFRYSMVLDPSGGYGGVASSTAEAGDYVFIRQEYRSRSTDWSALLMDYNTGRVWKKGQNGSPVELYKDNTYLTVQVLKNAGSDDVILAQNTYGDFRAALERETNARAEDLRQALETELGKLVTRRVQIKSFDYAQKSYESMITRAKKSDTNSKALAKQDAFDLYQMLKDAIIKLNNPSPDVQKESNLSADQVDALLRKLRAQATVGTESDLKKFTNALDGFPTMSFDEFVQWVVDKSSQ
jgi:hypothetical protein